MMAEEKKSGSLGATCIDTCCWQTRGSFDHASIERWLFELNDQVGKENRSCIERCYLCGTKPKSPRPVEIPEKLRGIIYQADSVDGKAKNGVLITHTWNYAKWYPEQRLLVSRIHEPSSWTFREPIVTRCMDCCGRCIQLTYKLQFADEELRNGSLDLHCNCLCCLPCLPAWCPMPKVCMQYKMVEAKDSQNGENYDRDSYVCCWMCHQHYSLVKIVDKDGQHTKYYDIFVKDLQDGRAPARVIMT